MARSAIRVEVGGELRSTRHHQNSRRAPNCMMRGPFCWAVMMPKMLLEFASDAELKFAGAEFTIKVCALPPEEKTTRLNALKKFA